MMLEKKMFPFLVFFCTLSMGVFLAWWVSDVKRAVLVDKAFLYTVTESMRATVLPCIGKKPSLLFYGETGPIFGLIGYMTQKIGAFFGIDSNFSLRIMSAILAAFTA